MNQQNISLKLVITYFRFTLNMSFFNAYAYSYKSPRIFLLYSNTQKYYHYLYIFAIIAHVSTDIFMNFFR